MLKGLTDIPEKMKLAYLKGYQTAINDVCGKLEAQVFKIQKQIELLKDEDE